MADKKISALTAATTPLAGTEVLPIVQSGSTVKVSVANLTAGRAVQVSTLEIPLGSAAAPPIFATGDSSTGIYASAAGALSFASQGYIGAEVSTSNDWRVYRRAAASQYLLTSVTASGANILASAGTGVLNLGVGTTTYLSYSSSTGDGTFSGGNLVQGTAAKGINFTANTPAAGMTRQLLNWYEEGTFTPTLTTDGTGFTSVTYANQSGTYTRVGRQVTVTVFMRTNGITVGSASGNLCIGGLPFTSASRQNATPYLVNLPISQNFNTANPTHLTMYGGWNYVAFQLNNANTYASYTYANTGASPANTAAFTFTYIVD